uniref:DC1 domain-containing protein n=1 Tax=Nymphaea colorata TaxID=210225 RepID=A0A5K1GD31_9MAGN
MGRLQKEEAMVHHFSHDHLLQLMPFTQSSHANLHTRCCGPPPSSICATMNDPIYACTHCNFSIHKSCSKLPRLIKHRFHPSHDLTLLPLPVYLNGSFSCDACSNDSSSAFSYHCSHCDYDLHTHCASLPLTATHPSHPHTLSLSFLFPPPEKAFTCGVCLAKGGSAWHYGCSPCGFAAHLHCARAAHPTPTAVSPCPSTGIPVRPPPAPVRPPSQVSRGTGLTVHGRPMGQLSNLPIVGSLVSNPAALASVASIACSLVGIPPVFTGLAAAGLGRIGRPNRGRPNSLASSAQALGLGGGSGGDGGSSVGDGGAGYDCNLNSQSDIASSGFDFGAFGFGGC